MKEKPYVKVAMYALNIIFAIIIIVPVVYCFNVSMMDLKEIYGGKFWPSHLTIENYTRAFQLAPFFTFIKNSLIVSGVITFAQVVTGALAAYVFCNDGVQRQKSPVLYHAGNHDDPEPGDHHRKLPDHR